MFSLPYANFHFQLGIGNALFLAMETFFKMWIQLPGTCILRILDFIYGKSSCMHEIFVVKSKLPYMHTDVLCINNSACTNIFNRTFGLFSDSLFQDWWYKWIEKNLY